MNLARQYYWIDTLGRNVFSLRGATALLSGLGLMWAIVEPTSFFSEKAGAAIRSVWWLFLLLGGVYAVWLCRPFLSVSCRLDGRDVGIEIRVGDVFKTPGVLVVGTNTTFDTRIEPPISERSIQGQFTRKYFPNEAALDLALVNQLQGIASEELVGPRVGKNIRYPVGTTVVVDAKGIRSFWVAIAHMNEHGAAVTSVDDLQEALAKFWVRTSEMGTNDSIVMPALGSRFGQLTLSREEIVRLTIQSFLAACAERTFCERLVIVLSAEDVTRHKIDLQELGEFLRFTCRYTAPTPKGAPVGVAVG